jgi:hypothetical protein
MAVRFDADENYSATYTLGSQANYSVTCWGRLAVDRNDYTTFWSFDANSDGTAFILQTDIDGTSSFVWDDIVAGMVGAGPALTVGTWYFFAVCVAGTSGALHYRTATTGFTTVTWTGAARTITNFLIGDDRYTEWLNGNVAALKFWTAGLTLAEVANESMQYAPVRTANLAAFYPLVSAETTDYSGNARTLTGGGTATTEDGPPIAWQSGRPRLILPAGANAVTATPTEAAATGTAQTPAVALIVPSGVSTATGVAQAPTVAGRPAPGVASGSATANAPTIATVATAGVATASAVAQAPASALLVPAGFGSATGAALAPSAAVVVRPSAAAGTGAALAATVSTSANVVALAEVALASVAAAGPAVAIIPTSAPATGAAAGQGGTVNVASVPATATGVAAGQNPAVALVGSAGPALAAGLAQAPTGSGTPAAGLASATGVAHGPRAAVVPTADIALGAGLALAPSIGGTATETLILTCRVRTVWHTDDAVPRWTAGEPRATWSTGDAMLTRSTLSKETVLFGPVRYLVDGVATSPTALTVEVAMTAASAGSDPSSWVTAAWSTIVASGLNTYWVKITLGPGTTLGAQAVGLRKAWVRITATGETPILQAGYIEFV